MHKIDFFGGLHGNYLELLANVFIYQNHYDLTKPLFNEVGACHLKEHDPTYQKYIQAHHWSHFQIPFNSDDVVVRIVLDHEDMLIAVINSFYRAGDQVFDLETLEKDTINKLKKLPKADKFLDTLIKDFGIKIDYPRSLLRNYFYSMFDSYEHGLGMYIDFDPTIPKWHNFPFRAFFDLRTLCVELNSMSKFLGLNFYPTQQISVVHQEFLRLNQGITIELRSRQIFDDIMSGKNSKIEKLTLPEEAWISWQIAKIFRCYDLPILNQDSFPNNTRDISLAVYDWKSKDYPPKSNT